MGATSTRQPAEPAAPKPARRKLLTRDERQAAIIHGAARAFAERGYSDTSMEDVARASGVTKLILYRNFESKEALYRSVLEAVRVRLAEVFVTEFSASRRPAGSRTLLTVAREEPSGFVLLWRHAAREPAFAEYAHDHRDMVVAVIRELIAPRFTDTSMLDWAASALVSWNVESVLAWLEKGDPERDDEFLTMVGSSGSAMLAAWSRDGAS